MVKFNLGLTQTNPVENKILIQLEKAPNVAPFIHQAQLELNANEALKLVDEIKKAIINISESK